MIDAFKDKIDDEMAADHGPRCLCPECMGEDDGAWEDDDSWDNFTAEGGGIE